MFKGIGKDEGGHTLEVVREPAENQEKGGK